MSCLTVAGNASIVTGDHLPLAEFSTVTVPFSDEKRVKRIAYLAEVRNRAMRPLDSPSKALDPFASKSDLQRTSVIYDRILFLNDVYFNPVAALQLLFSTNLDPNTGRPSYRAACGIDFWRYAFVYDTFVIRDLEGFKVGLGLYPWFLPYGGGRAGKMY
ncbi:hypothetical protein MMC13_007975 [Lambiella insularis]|nr:hypothetical protein [Lambiella insularis]